MGIEPLSLPAGSAVAGQALALQQMVEFFSAPGTTWVAPHTLASFASNHDQFAGKRLWDQVSGNETHYKLAAATYLLLPGTPFIYYGEEIGMGRRCSETPDYYCGDAV